MGENLRIDENREVGMLTPWRYGPRTRRHDGSELVIRGESYILRPERLLEIPCLYGAVGMGDDEVPLPLRMEEDILAAEARETEAHAHRHRLLAGVRRLMGNAEIGDAEMVECGEYVGFGGIGGGHAESLEIFPTDGSDRTCPYRFVDAFAFIIIERLHSGHVFFVHREDVSSETYARATADTCVIHHRTASESGFESIDLLRVDRRHHRFSRKVIKRFDYCMQIHMICKNDRFFSRVFMKIFSFLSRFSVFEILTRILLVILPFHVFLTVFMQFKVGIPSFAIYKEVLVLGLILSLAYEFFRTKTRPQWDILDQLVTGYIGYMVLITVIMGGTHIGETIKALFVGGRYDFEFLIVMLVYRHGNGFLAERLGYYMRLFLISATVMIILSILVRFVFKETILIYFGFSANLSTWDFGGSIPIYHGIPGANIRRFQGILDGPNAAAFFLVVYLGVLTHYFRMKKDSYMLLGAWSTLMIGLIFLTYCRSALVGLAGALVVTGLIYGRVIWQKYMRSVLIAVGVISIVVFAFTQHYNPAILHNIINRDGSSKGHFERMMTGIKRFESRPLGQGLASSGPGYRYLHVPPGVSLTEGEVQKMENFSIPESWYVQVLVEGGIIGIVLFLAILGVILMRLVRRSLPLFVAFLAVLIMNAFLHTFESMYVSIVLFAFVGWMVADTAKKIPETV